jgi:hypothetical protein
MRMKTTASGTMRGKAFIGFPEPISVRCHGLPKMLLRTGNLISDCLRTRPLGQAQ